MSRRVRRRDECSIHFTGGAQALRAAVCVAAAAMFAASSLGAQGARENDLKLPIGGTPGALDAITDVAGVEVGHTTIIRGSGKLVVGQGPVRTGVTVVHPRGKRSADPVFGAWFTLNGNGEMTGTTWLQEGGFLEGPIAITNTHSVGVVRDAILQWQVGKPGMQPWGLPVVAETYDGGLNDINGFHVKPEHVFAALDGAKSGPVQEGPVGGGTGMVCHGFKGGIGTASRVLSKEQGGYTVGVLVQCNYGSRRDLRIAGVPVGEEIPDLTPCYASAALPPENPRGAKLCGASNGGDTDAANAAPEMGSIIVIVATDAPLVPHQLQRLVKRVAVGLGREGGFGGNGSGDIFVAFSTANPGVGGSAENSKVEMVSNGRISPLFYATAQAVEGAITNALLAGQDMVGANDLKVFAMPRDRMLAVMRKYGRLQQ